MCGKSLFVLLYLFFWLLITSLVSFDYCIVCPSQIYDCWLPLWCLVAIVLSVLLRFTAADYLFGILWPLCCLSFSALRLLITSLVSCGHCVVCPSSLYGCWLPLWYIVAIVLSVLLRFTAADYHCGVLWPLCCLSFFTLRLLITPLVSFDYCVVCPSSVYGCWLPLWCLQTCLTCVLNRACNNWYLMRYSVKLYSGYYQRKSVFSNMIFILWCI